MKLKATPAKDLKIGDYICEPNGAPLKINDIVPADGEIKLCLESDGFMANLSVVVKPTTMIYTGTNGL